MSNGNWRDRFPNLRPIGGPPSLFTLNGIGTTIYGSRDNDRETGTYVTTLCLTVLFVPLFCLSAYRVANAPNGGWYFLGKEPLSTFAKIWNMLVVLSIVGVFASIAGAQYFNSPDFVDGRKLARAQRLVAQGDLPAAATEFELVVRGGTRHRGAALAGLQQIVAKHLATAPLEHSPPVLQIAVNLQRSSDWPTSSEELLKSGLELTRQHAKQDSLAALNTFEAIKTLDAANAEVVALQRELLETIVAAHPQNLPHVVGLCELLETEGQLERCRKLLAPLQSQLADTEGARILGQMLAHDGDFDAAHALLVPYTKARLEQLHEAEKDLTATFETVQEEKLAELRRGDGPASFYSRYDGATEEVQQQLVDEQLLAATKDNSSIVAAQERLIEKAKIVPTALDLGIVLLRRAQNLTSPDERKQELEQAEQTFLAIRGVAGETDEYRMFLGQVYYWLGKHDEGKKLFDELLAANNRSATMLMAVGNTLREVGETSQARTVVEEAYNQSTDQDEKFAAAHQRALLWDELDDQIEWLRLANPLDPHVTATLSTSLGYQAQLAGSREVAEQHFRDAIAAYEKMPESASVLNNSAMAYLALYQATGDAAALAESQRRIEKAVSLSPSDSIVLYNAATMLLRVAVIDVTAGKIDVAAIQGLASPSLLPYLYADQAGRDAWRQRLREHSALKKSQEYLAKLLVLSPKQLDVYRHLQTIYVLADDPEPLAQLVARIHSAKPDVSLETQQQLDFYHGKDDAKALKQATEAVALWGNIAANRAAHDATFAVATDYASRQQAALAVLGETQDVDEIVAAIERASAAAPSVQMQRSLRHFLLFRADRQLQSNPDFAQLYERSKRTITPGDRIALALAQEGELRDLVLASADVQRAIKLIEEDGQQFPDERTPWEWAMLRYSRPATAAEFAQSLAQNKVDALNRAIEELLEPIQASPVLELYWTKLAADDVDGATDVLRAAHLRGVILPMDPPGPVEP